MTRIIAGAARGRRLKVPAGDGTRPTTDRVREALFSSLESALGGFAGLRVLDLYAGSGALGLEAASRGAEHVLLVEDDAAAVRVIQANVAAVGRPGVQVRQASVHRVLAHPPTQPYGLVVADPPYDIDGIALAHTLAALTTGWLASGALVVVERPRRAAPLVWPDGVIGLRDRRYGETVLWYGHSAE